MPTIALVDDDRNILTSVSLSLEAEGYRVQSYTDGASALDGLKTNPADLAIFDIKMPRMDGMELLRRLRQKSDLPVIFLTSKDDEIDELFGLKMGVQYAIEHKNFVADGVEGPALGFELFALLRFDAGGNGFLAVADGQLNGLARIQFQASQLVETPDNIRHAGRDVGFGSLEGGVFQQIAFEIGGFAAYGS